MPLVTTKDMFKKAYEGGYAIGAFNVNNMEIVQGITEAAKEVNAPLILQVSAGARKYANHTYLMKLIEAAIIETGLPIAVHLDHGDSFELCKWWFYLSHDRCFPSFLRREHCADKAGC
jgi:fructose-bisphosphate aldolase class II